MVEKVVFVKPVERSSTQSVSWSECSCSKMFDSSSLCLSVISVICVKSFCHIFVTRLSCSHQQTATHGLDVPDWWLAVLITHLTFVTKRNQSRVQRFNLVTSGCSWFWSFYVQVSSWTGFDVCFCFHHGDSQAASVSWSESPQGGRWTIRLVLCPGWGGLSGQSGWVSVLETTLSNSNTASLCRNKRRNPVISLGCIINANTHKKRH